MMISNLSRKGNKAGDNFKVQKFLYLGKRALRQALHRMHLLVWNIFLSSLLTSVLSYPTIIV